ncbi:MAG TPA: glycosyltransferase family 1 protein [Planctomycetes bacterium]|nr:glycosyltransferase family 1 protein [Planctomycetota bacterium]
MADHEPRLKVLHIITRFILGGAQENTLLTLIGLRGHPRYEPLLATGPAIGPEGSLLERARSENIRTVLIPELVREISPWNDWKALRYVRRLIREIHPAIVHTHSSKAGIIGREAAHRENVPAVVHTIHGPPFHPREKPWRNRLYAFLERRAAGQSHAVISVADAMTAQFLAQRIGSPSLYTTIRSGMEVEPYLAQYDRDALRSSLAIPPDAFVVAKIARIAPLKGHEDLLNAAAEARSACPSLHLLLVGDGELRISIEALAAKLGLSSAVTFTGLVPPSRIPELLAAADCLVHASYREGLPRAVVQAMLSALPVVVYNVDGAPEVVSDARTGFLVAPGDVHGLAASVQKLASNPSLAADMGRSGRERVRNDFDWKEMVRRIAALYDRLL